MCTLLIFALELKYFVGKNWNLFEKIPKALKLKYLLENFIIKIYIFSFSMIRENELFVTTEQKSDGIQELPDSVLKLNWFYVG